MTLILFFTLATTPSNQQNRLLTTVQVLYLLEVFILAHYYYYSYCSDWNFPMTMHYGGKKIGGKSGKGWLDFDPQ